jgi:Ca2+-binding RTX toxin-like protein
MKTLLVCALLTALPLVPGSAAEAAPSCQGEAATLVGRPGSTVHGTMGADVVVTNGASRVVTLDGDDLVCVTGATRDGKRMRMDTGPGNDRVAVTGRNAVKVFLGDGDDAFDGGRENDVVFAGYPDSYDYSPIDTGTDIIRTGGGDDLVRSNGAADSLSLGKGADTVLWTATTGTVDGGRGHNRMILLTGSAANTPPVSWVLDNVAGRLTRDRVAAFTWERFDEFKIPFLTRADEPLLVLGSAADEVFDLSAGTSPLAGGVTIRAHGGDDTMRGTGQDDVLVGGPGHDTADGRGGEDRCLTEVRDRCEAR